MTSSMTSKTATELLTPALNTQAPTISRTYVRTGDIDRQAVGERRSEALGGRRTRPNVALGASDRPNVTLGAPDRTNATMGRLGRNQRSKGPLLSLVRLSNDSKGPLLSPERREGLLRPGCGALGGGGLRGRGLRSLARTRLDRLRRSSRRLARRSLALRRRALRALLRQQLRGTLGGQFLNAVGLPQGRVVLAIGHVRAEAAVLDHHRLAGHRVVAQFLQRRLGRRGTPALLRLRVDLQRLFERDREKLVLCGQ